MIAQPKVHAVTKVALIMDIEIPMLISAPSYHMTVKLVGVTGYQRTDVIVSNVFQIQIQSTTTMAKQLAILFMIMPGSSTRDATLLLHFIHQ
jgi:hypothetical protein